MADFQIPDKTLLTTIDRAADSWLIYDNSATALKRTTINYALDLTSHPVGVDDTQTLTAKTLTSPTINGATLSGTLTGTYTIGGTPTFPSSVVTLTGSQTLTNKVLTSPTINNATVANPTLTVDTVSEYTTANGVTVDSLNIKDGKLNTNDSVVTANITDGAVTNAKMATDVKPYTLFNETTFDFVASGCVWSGDSYGSTRAASMTAGVVYINGQRVAVSAVTARSFTASRDTYIDVGTDGVVDYSESTNNAASQALAANHVRLGIIVTGASSIANVGSVNQGEETKVLPINSSIPYQVTDSLGNLICPRDPVRRLIGSSTVLSTFTTASTSAVQITGLSRTIIVPSGGRKLEISIDGSYTYNVSAGFYTHLSLWSGTVASGTQLQESAAKSVNAGDAYPISVKTIVTLAAGTYTINGGLRANGGTSGVVASTDKPLILSIKLL